MCVLGHQGAAPATIFEQLHVGDQVQYVAVLARAQTTAGAPTGIQTWHCANGMVYILQTPPVGYVLFLKSGSKVPNSTQTSDKMPVLRKFYRNVRHFYFNQFSMSIRETKRLAFPLLCRTIYIFSTDNKAPWCKSLATVTRHRLTTTPHNIPTWPSLRRYSTRNRLLNVSPRLMRALNKHRFQVRINKERLCLVVHKYRCDRQCKWSTAPFNQCSTQCAVSSRQSACVEAVAYRTHCGKEMLCDFKGFKR